MKATSRQYAEALLESVNSDNLSSVVKKFWYKLQKENSYNLLPEVIANLDEACAKKEGKMLVKVYSPQPLSDEQRQRISEEVNSKYNKKTLIKNIIDSELEIGYRIETDDEVFDNTFKNKMNNLKTFIS